MTAYPKAYLQWYLNSQRKKIMMYVGVLAVVVALPMWLIITDNPHDMLITATYIVLVIDTLGALIIPILQFRYLMNQRACDLYLPLPIKRKQMFFMQFGTGTMWLFLPNLMYLIAAVGNAAARSYWKGYVFLMIILMFFAFVQYSVDTFLVLQCQNLIDAIFAMAGFLLTQFLVIATIEILLSNTVNAVLPNGGSIYEFFPNWLNLLLSPIYSAMASINALDDMVGRETILYGFAKWQEYSGIHPFFIVVDALLAGIAVYFAQSTYEKHKGEDGEQKTTSKWIYPLLITLVSGCLIFENILSLNYFIFTVILYFIMNFVAQRKIVVQLRMVIRFVVLVIAALGISRLLIDTKGFGLIQDSYTRNELVRVQLDINFMDMDYSIPESEQETLGAETIEYLTMSELQDDVWLVDHVYELQKDITAHNEYSDTPVAYINISYELTNHKQIYRYYKVDQKHLDQVHEIADYLIDHHYCVEGWY